MQAQHCGNRNEEKKALNWRQIDWGVTVFDWNSKFVNHVHSSQTARILQHIWGIAIGALIGTWKIQVSDPWLHCSQECGLCISCKKEEQIQKCNITSCHITQWSVAILLTPPSSSGHGWTKAWTKMWRGIFHYWLFHHRHIPSKALPSKAFSITDMEKSESLSKYICTDSFLPVIIFLSDPSLDTCHLKGEPLGRAKALSR